MSLHVEGVGDVLIRWMPASDEDFRDKSEGARGGYQPIAIVHHRGVVDSLAGLDRTFAASDADPATVGSPGRPVSSNFGIGDIAPNVIAISQYVDLSDTAYCNGDCQAGPNAYPGQPSNWDTWYGHYGHNERTVSIEHDDNGGSSDAAVKGIVTEAILKTSIALDRLLLSGDIAAIRAAGIRIRDQATADALKAIKPSTKTLIDHHDIAGKLKPSCWKPWSADHVGFPRTRYVTEVAAPAPTPTPPAEEDMPALSSYIPGQIATVKAGMNIRTAPKLAASVIRVTSAPEAWLVTGFTKGDVDGDCGSDQWLTRWSGGRWEYTSSCNLAAGPADLTPFAQKDLDTARSKGIADAATAAGNTK